MGSETFSWLLERERELDALADALEAARDGTGRIVVIEGVAGVGKTVLLDAAEECADRLGGRVLRARCEELLVPAAWSTATELLAPAVAGLPTAEQQRLLAGPGEPARELLTGVPVPDRPSGPPLAATAITHALVWVLSGMAARSPLALLVDDVGWADGLSLQFLAQAASRLGDLPVAIVVARRRSEPGEADPALLDRLATQAGSLLLELSPLSAESSKALVHRRLGERVDDELAQACAEVAGGNPFYLDQLLAELDAQGAGLASLTPESVRTLTPASVRRAVLVRLARLGPSALALSQAIAVLGDRAAFTVAADLAGLGRSPAAAALDGLVGAGILRDAEPLGFVHPLVASTVYAEIPLTHRGELHVQAAKLLSNIGADSLVIGGHLLSGARRAELWVVEALQEAARTALWRGAPAAAADYLARALEEPPPAEARVEVLRELARAEAAAGRPEAGERFELLLGLVEDRRGRARIHLELGQALSAQGRHADALSVYERGMGEQENELEDDGRELRAAYWTAKTMTGQMSPEELGRLERLVTQELEDPTPGERALLAVLAMASAFQCQPRARVTELACRAWGDGALLAAETSDGLSWTLVTGALMHADELELELQVVERALADARRRGSLPAVATATYIRGGVLATMGQNCLAIADLEAALNARHDGWSQYVGTAAGVLCRALLERDDLDGARQALQIAEADPSLADSIEYSVILVGRGELLLRDGRPAEALERFEAAGRILTAQGFDYVAWAPWGPGAVRALLALDCPDRARLLASELVEHARRLGAPSALALSLRALAQTNGNSHTLELLEEAVGLFDQRPERLQHAYALVEYGAALRRAGRRAAAADPLRRGLGMAEHGGLKVLAAQATAELAAAGARTRRHALSGAAALTPTERRVTELAADDRSNREIAQQLFVTVRTVEYHLNNAYRKLGVRSRAGLASALAGADTASAAPEERRGDGL